MEGQLQREIRFEGGYRDQLAQAFEKLFPASVREPTASQMKDHLAEVRQRELQMEDTELEELLKIHNMDRGDLKLFLTIERQEYPQEVYTLPVHSHFSSRHLPKGYAYRGGAARSLLFRSLGIDPSYVPRDIDVIRLKDDLEEQSARDDQVAREFMPEDYQDGHGIEVVKDFRTYFATRDLTLNEVLATDTQIFATRRAILDIIRHIIRPTMYERILFGGKNIGPKMLAKILRFYVEAIYRYDEAGIRDVDDWQFEENHIPPIWLAVQLDRAYEVNAEVAEQYIHELV